MKCKLSDVSTIKYGKDHKHLIDGKIPVYGSGGVMRYANTALYNKESVLIPRKGSLGNLFFVDKPFWTVDTLFYTEIDETKIIPKYFYYYLKTLDLAKMNVGTAVPSLTTSVLNEIQIDLPPLSEQKIIADTLSALDYKIENNNKINHHLEQMAQAIFKSWFVDFEPFGGVMPSDWEIATLDTIVNFQNGFAFKSKDLLNKQEFDTYQVFKQGHINRGGGFIPNGTKNWYPKSLATTLDKFVLHKGDILMAMTDMKDNVAILGNTAIMPVDNEYIVNQRVGHLRATGYKGITYPYIYLLTNSVKFLSDLRGRANSGVQVNLSSSEIKASEVIVATEAINNSFTNIAIPIFEQIIKNQQESAHLATLRDTLLPRLMSGEIDVSKIEDYAAKL